MLFNFVYSAFLLVLIGICIIFSLFLLNQLETNLRGYFRRGFKIFQRIFSSTTQIVVIIVNKLNVFVSVNDLILDLFISRRKSIHT